MRLFRQAVHEREERHDPDQRGPRPRRPEKSRTTLRVVWRGGIRRGIHDGWGPGGRWERNSGEINSSTHNILEIVAGFWQPPDRRVGFIDDPPAPVVNRT